MKRLTKLSLATAMATLSGVGFAGVAQAQTAPAPAPAADPAAEPEVVVTAQRRSENLQTVPVAITVVSGESLRNANINSTETLDRVVPSLTFKRGTANVNSTIAIRGLGTQSFASGAEPSVSTIIDGVVYGRSGMATQEFADIDRIEVLRGPQGTLFGKNASVGALNITTRAPTSKLTVDASAAYFGRAEYRASGVVSGALTNKIAGLVSAYYGNYDGNAPNVFNNTRVNGYDKWGVKGKFRFDLGDVTVNLNGDYSRENNDCCGDILGITIPNAQFANIFLPQQRPVVPSFGNRSLNYNFTPGTIDQNSGVSLTVDWQIGSHTLTSITAYRNWYNRQLRDGDFGSQSGQYVAVANATTPAATQNIDQRDDGALDFNQYSQEIRLASPSGGRFEYVLGGFFWWTDENDTFTRSDTLCSSSTLAIDATGFRPCSTAAGASTFITTSGTGNWTTRFRSQAGFAQATFEIVPKLKLIGGIRYTNDTVSYNYVRTVSANSVTDATLRPGIQGPFAFAESANADGVSGRAGLQFQANDDLLLYGTYSRGYKGPALNVFFSITAANTGAIAPETSNAYELGLKAKLFDRKLTLNLALYNQDVYNFQANSFVTQGAQTFVTLTNAGRVQSRGFEVDFSWRATPRLTFNGGYTYNEGTIREFRCNAATLTAAQLATCLAHNGRPLPFAPKHKLNIAMDWRLPVTDAVPFDVRLGSSIAYTSRINFDLDQTPLAQQPPYELVDMNLTFATKDGRFELALLAKNLTDSYYTSFITPAGNGVTANSYQRLQVPRDAERYFGIRARFKY